MGKAQAKVGKENVIWAHCKAVCFLCKMEVVLFLTVEHAWTINN